MKKIGHTLYLSGLWLFILTSVYFVAKDYFFEKINIEELTGIGPYMFILLFIISSLLFVIGIAFIKRYENKHESAKIS